MSTAPWDEAPTTYADADTFTDTPGFGQPLQVRPQRHHDDRAGLGELASLAIERGPREQGDMIRRAQQVGHLLGQQLRSDGSCRGYYSWEQGGSVIEGPTIDLMDALAAEWGRILTSVTILEESDDRVRLRGRIVDLLTLAAVERDYVSALSPPPGRFARKPEQRQRWMTSQVQSASSKAVRGALEHALPAWYVGAAVDAAKVAHARAILGDKTLGETADKAADYLGRKHGLVLETLVGWLDTPRERWTVDHVARLRKLAEDLQQGRTTVDQVRADAMGATPQPAQAQPAQSPADGDRLAGTGLKRPETTRERRERRERGETRAPTTTPPPPPEKPEEDELTAKPDQAAADAECIRQVLESVGHVASERDLRNAFYQARDLARCSDGRWRAALSLAVASNYALHDEGAYMSPGHADQVDAAAAEPEWAGQPEPMPTSWPAHLPHGDALVAALQESVDALGEAEVERAFRRAGIPSIDGAPLPGLRRLFMAVAKELRHAGLLDDGEE